ncbi:MAG: hypothetical protein NW207_04760 [Cytophagales bacterium]|nr:hypothetical protein [Cytophagales bacterium]
MASCESTEIVSASTTIDKTIEYIKRFTIAGSLNSEIKAIASECRYSSDVLKCVFDAVYTRVVYSPDPPNRQVIKAVHCTLSNGIGNCTDYSILIGAILINLRIPFAYKVVSYSEPGQYEHIYIVSRLNNKDIYLDCVLGQRQDGSDTIANRPEAGLYNKEVKYKYYKIYPMTQLEILQGVRELQTGNKRPLNRVAYFRRDRDVMSSSLGFCFLGIAGDCRAPEERIADEINNNSIEDTLINPLKLLVAEAKGKGLVEGGDYIKIGENIIGKDVIGLLKIAGIGVGAYILWKMI